MTRKRGFDFSKFFVDLNVFLLIFPLVLQFIWIFTSRWQWPSLIPNALSLRAIKEITSPYLSLGSILYTNMLFSLTVAILSSLIAILSARALVFYEFRGKNLIDTFSLVPILVPSTVLSMGLHLVFIRAGIYDSVFAVLLVHLIYALPYSIGIMKNIFVAIGQDLEIQAMTLGANRFQAFVFVSLPNMKRAISSSLTMAYILSFSQYFVTLIIGGGTFKTLNILMVPIIANGDRQLASTYAFVFVASTSFVFALINLCMKIIFERKNQ